MYRFLQQSFASSATPAAISHCTLFSAAVHATCLSLNSLYAEFSILDSADPPAARRENLVKIRSELVANIALTVMCLLVSGVVVERYVIQRFVKQPDTGEYRQGQRLTGDMGTIVNSKSARVTAVVVVSQRCKFCQESVDFYRRLVALPDVREGRVQILFMGYHAEDAKAFLVTHQLPVDDLRATPSDLRAKVQGTPTVLIVDRNGLIMGAWKGKLNSNQERNVFTTVSTMVANSIL